MIADSPTSDGPRDRGRRVSVAAGVFVFVFASLGYPLLPMIVGTLSDHLHFSATQVGAVASSEMLGMFLASLAALIWIRRVSWRAMAVGFGVLLVAGDIVSGEVHGFALLTALRFVSGFAAGSLLALGATAVGDSDSPERNVALLNVAQTAVCALAFLVMPKLIDRYATAGAFIFLAALASPVILLSRALSDGGRRGPRATPAATPVAPQAVMLTLFAAAPAFLFFVAYAASWTFMERVGVAAGLSQDAVGAAMSLSLVAGMFGSFAAWALALRWGRVAPAVITLAFQIVSLAMLIWFAKAAGVYMAALMIYVFFVNFPASYQVGLAVSGDRTGRAAVIYLLMLKAGVAVAPLFASLFVRGRDYRAPLVISAVFYSLCLINFWGAAKLVRKDNADRDHGVQSSVEDEAAALSPQLVQ